jgi:L-lactate dehydrogenase complex protein LldE
MQVSLFVTCLTDLFSPQVGMATVRVLEHFGCAVDFPEGQTCCGQPQFNNGHHSGARTLGERMIRVFEESTVVVTPSASCCAMIREHYPVLFKDDAKWEGEAQALAAKTYELVEFLTKVLKADLSTLRLPERTTVACHYTCHNRGLHQGREVHARAAAALGAEVVPLEKGEQCCGFGGTFAVKYPEISGPLALDKVACAERSGAEVLLVNDAGCAMNIAGAAHRAAGARGNAKFKTRHIAELMAEAIEARQGGGAK